MCGLDVLSKPFPYLTSFLRISIMFAFVTGSFFLNAAEAEKEYWVKVRAFQDKVRSDSGGRGSFHGRGRGSYDRPQRFLLT